MNEEKLLELLKDLVGGDRAFQWVGEQMGKGIHKSYDKTHKAAHAVIGGMALVCRGGHNPAAPVPEETVQSLVKDKLPPKARLRDWTKRWILY